MMNRVGKAVFFNLFEAEYEDGLKCTEQIW